MKSKLEEAKEILRQIMKVAAVLRSKQIGSDANRLLNAVIEIATAAQTLTEDDLKP